MADSVSGAIIANGHEALAKGYAKTRRFMHASDAKGRVIRAMRDNIQELPSVGLLNSQVRQFSSVHSVSVKINSVSKDVITEMAKLPVNVNIEIANKIRAEIQSGNWPKNKAASSRAVKAAMQDYIDFVAR